MLAQTYPNRRFLLAGTAFGLIATELSSITGIPPNGTIFDRLDAHGISWASYATNVSTLYVISDIVTKNPNRIKTIDQFHADAKSGSLPAVSYVDPNILTGTEENPQDLSLGEHFVSTVVGSLLNSPAWDRTLLVWTYDEHGGYYDHVPPPAAIPPDDIPPDITATDQPGGYDRYGFRVPTVVVSPYSKPHFVSHTVYDHTSVLKTIERKWNLPAMTYRDANANDLLDCLDLSTRAFADPPTWPRRGTPPASPLRRCRPPGSSRPSPPSSRPLAQRCDLASLTGRIRSRQRVRSSSVRPDVKSWFMPGSTTGVEGLAAVLLALTRVDRRVEDLNGTLSRQVRNVVPGVAGLEQDLLGVLPQLRGAGASRRHGVGEADGRPHHVRDGPGQRRGPRCGRCSRWL